MKKNPQSALDTDQTIQSKRILRVRYILTKPSNEKESSECRDTNETLQ